MAEKSRLKYNNTAVGNAKAKDGKVTEYRIEGTPGLFLVVSPEQQKPKRWLYRYRPRGGGAPRKLAIGQYNPNSIEGAPQPPLGAHHTLAEARQAAEALARQNAAGTDLAAAKREALKPVEGPETFNAVAERFIKLWVDEGGRARNGIPLRSKGEIERQLNAYVLPKWRDKPLVALDRDAVTKLMDNLVGNHGPVQADRVLATLSTLFNWHASRKGGYVSPIVRSMKRSGKKKRGKLTHGQIRAIWEACGDAGTFGALCRVALLTAQRRAKLRTMRWDDLRDGIWHIRAEAREKGNAGALKLPKQALNIIKTQPVIKDNPYVFAGAGAKAFNSFSKCKRALDEAAGVEDWEVDKETGVKGYAFHDLRHAAKTLMVEAGVLRHISERVLGHVIPGVEGDYDHHDYSDEKATALEALAALVDRILDPPGDIDVPITGAGAG